MKVFTGRGEISCINATTAVGEAEGTNHGLLDTAVDTVNVLSGTGGLFLNEADAITVDTLAPITVNRVANNKTTSHVTDAVQEDLILAILVTGLVMLVFLHTVRSTFIVLLAIATSLISTVLVMWVLGFSLNVLTLLALTLTIGILVDDSVVVLENIERHLKMKKKPKQAALDAEKKKLAAVQQRFNELKSARSVPAKNL